MPEIARALLSRLEGRNDLDARGTALCIRAWVDDAQTTIADWLRWAHRCTDAQAWPKLHYFDYAFTAALRRTGQADALVAYGQAAWEWLQGIVGEEVASLRYRMTWNRFNFHSYLDVGDLESAEKLARRAIEQEGYSPYGAALVEVAARRGEPTPPDVVRVVEEGGVDALDDYGLQGWYVIAREAAAAGREKEAFEALERALGYWSNPPYWPDRVWENDAYWGRLREHPEVKRIYAAKQARIGPIYGELHYFPGW